MTDKKVVTLQDISCFGQCSLTVALPIISACGVETVILPSAVLSTHTGGFTGPAFKDLTEDIPSIMNHWQREELTFDCLYTGYLASVTQIDYVTDLRNNIIKKDGLLIVDPAMADHGKLYKGFDNEFVKHMASLCGKADIILPNLTEAAFMTDSEFKSDSHDEGYVEMLLQKLAALGTKKIILKGVHFNPEKMGIAIYDAHTKNIQYYFHERQPRNSHGTGDCFASAFTGALMQGKEIYQAATIAADFVVECLKQTGDDASHMYGVRFERALPLLVHELNK